MTINTAARTLLMSAVLLGLAAPGSAMAATGDKEAISTQVVSPEAQAVLDRMTGFMQGLQTFSIEAATSRDEVVSLGYKLQHNESVTLLVQRPNKLRAEVTGDIRDSTVVYDSGKLTMYSPDDAAFVRTDAPDSVGALIGRLMELGVDMPLIDVLYQATAGTLTEGVRGGILVGPSTIDGVPCDQLAFRQASVDWQLWVEKGDRPLPRKILITTRYEVGDPQFQTVLTWNLKPQVKPSTFAFVAPAGAVEIPLADQTSTEGGAR